MHVLFVNLCTLPVSIPGLEPKPPFYLTLLYHVQFCCILLHCLFPIISFSVLLDRIE